MGMFLTNISNNILLSTVFDVFWSTLTSKIAMYFYVVILLGLIVSIILLMIVNEYKRQDLVANHDALEKSNAAMETNEESKKHDDQVSRFFMLSQIDTRVKTQTEYHFEDHVTLEAVCEEFRQFAASSLSLYYDIADIRRFIAGLAVSHIMILQGMSGTGKTSLAYAFGDYLKNPTVVVPIQPMWKERTDLIGYYNEFTKKFNETTLLRKMYEANHNDQLYITVLDEVNIARVEYYFSEFLSLLELPDQEKRRLDVISDKWDSDPSLLKDGQLKLPANMWFVGTANNDDSTFSISDKVYDRAMVINLDKKAKPFIARDIAGRRLSATKFQSLIDRAQKEYGLSHRNLRRLRELDRYLMKQFQISFGNRIMQQIRRYVPIMLACGGSELSALDDVVSKKVLRKLETKNMVYVKNAAPGLIAFLEELFGKKEMTLCKEFIRNIEINV